MTALLEIDGLVIDYLTRRRIVRAVDDVSFDIQPGEIVGLAGESGCGKSTIALAILRLLRPPADIAAGRVLYRANDVLVLDRRALQRLRWRNISIVLQSAMNSLNPVIPIADQFLDTFKAHEHVSKGEAMEQAAELMKLVSIDPGRLRSYPHELSGGMRQRIIIALALALRPELIIMDEPTTALDVVVQRDILQQIQELQKELHFAVLFITHDLSLLVEVSHRIGIMYAGKLVEYSKADQLFRHPQHPYTLGLMQSFPSLTGEKRSLVGIPGSPPDLANPPPGCRFHPRCPKAVDVCARVQPPLVPVADGNGEHPHECACHLVAPLREPLETASPTG